MRLIDYYYDNRCKVWFLLLVTLLMFITFFEIVYEDFMLNFIVYPIIADARGKPYRGVNKGYNVFNTVFYLIITVITIIFIYDFFERNNISIDKELIMSLISWIIVGGLLRALQDYGYFGGEWNVLFITPLIYLMLMFVVLILIYVGDTELVNFCGFLMLLILIPIVLLLVSGRYISFFISIFIACLVSSIVVMINEIYTYVGSIDYNIYFDSVAFLVLFSQVFDGSTTYIAVEYYGYMEKQFFANMFMYYMGSEFFILFKMLIAVLIVYMTYSILDECDYEISNSVRLLAIVVGLAPAIRNIVRVMMYV